MNDQLENAIKIYQETKTSKESYEVISAFVEIISTCKDFTAYAEERGDNINSQKVAINNDKGYDLPRKAKIEHDKDRGRKLDALHDLDPLFPLSNLHHIHHAIQPASLDANICWIYKCSTPDEPLRPSRMDEYLMYMEKTMKNCEQYYTAYKVIPVKFSDVSEKSVNISLPEMIFTSYDKDTSIMQIGGHKIKMILQHKSRSPQRAILEYIFVENGDDLSDQFDYAFIAESALLDYDPQKTGTYKTYTKACEKLNDKILKGTNGLVKDFFITNSSNSGFIIINPKYLLSINKTDN